MDFDESDVIPWTILLDDSWGNFSDDPDEVDVSEAWRLRRRKENVAIFGATEKFRGKIWWHFSKPCGKIWRDFYTRNLSTQLFSSSEIPPPR